MIDISSIISYLNVKHSWLASLAVHMIFFNCLMCQSYNDNKNFQMINLDSIQSTLNVSVTLFDEANIACWYLTL